MNLFKNKKFFSSPLFSDSGFTLIEIVVATGVFVLFAVGIYSGITTVFRVAQESRTRIVQTAILSEQLETARNLAYNDVGILAGSPPGKLPYKKTVVRNGATFEITTTVRNIDDPYDGTIDGGVKDTAAADYKLVEMAISCTSCPSQKPTALSTRIAPKNLEGASDNGALFIHVFDAAGLPISGASVQVTNFFPHPDLAINDTTDMGGMLRLIDVPTGTLGYHIIVTKPGYSSDYTVSSTLNNPNPTRLPATVVSQSVTEMSFSIDKLSTLNLRTVNPACQALGNALVSYSGTKTIGNNPKIFKNSGSITTGAGGTYTFPSIEEDTYTFSVSGTAHDIAGTIPFNPVKIQPGSSQTATLVLRPHSARSLLVQVKDAGTGLPLSEATVRLVGTNYDKNAVTTLGYTRQTDWSGGGGQSDFVDDTRYFYDTGTLERASPAGDLKLKKTGMHYLPSGYLESSTVDLGSGVTFRNLITEPINQPPQAGLKAVRLQLATSPTPNPASWNFLGPNGTTSTFYTPTSTLIHAVHNNDRYVRYRVFLSTDHTEYSPQVSEIITTFTNECTPPGQAFFRSIPAAGTYTLTVTRNGYADTNGQIDIAGNTDVTVNMSPL